MIHKNNLNKVQEQLLLDLKIVFIKLIKYLDLDNIKNSFIEHKVIVSQGNVNIGKPIKVVQVQQHIKHNNIFHHQKL